MDVGGYEGKELQCLFWNLRLHTRLRRKEDGATNAVQRRQFNKDSSRVLK